VIIHHIMMFYLTISYTLGHVLICYVQYFHFIQFVVVCCVSCLPSVRSLAAFVTLNVPHADSFLACINALTKSYDQGEKICKCFVISDSNNAYGTESAI
jgi:hypothetical protein